MTTRKITIMALIGGIVLGAAATEGFNVYRRSHDSQIFQERLRCKAVADAYVKENTDLDDNSVTGTSVTLDKVDYSPARNTCVAEVETVHVYKGGHLTMETVEDLLSGETLFSATCTEDCGLVEAMFADHAFDYVMKNASEPHEVREALDSYKKSRPKSAPPSGH